MATRVESCIFCKIIDDKAPSEKIYEDEYVTCIKDINPASTHHYLILPKRHIRNAKDLKQEDAEIYDKMTSIVDRITEMKGLDAACTLTGFHWPPFNTVHHLHLHVISPTNEINMWQRFMFRPDSFWFVSTEYVRSYLQSRS